MDVGGIEGQYDVWCPIMWKGVTSIFGSWAPYLASLSTSSLHAMLFVHALTFWIATLCLGELMDAMMCVIRSLFGWLYCEEGCLMWLSRRYMLLRLFMKIKVSMFRDPMCSIAKSSA